MNRMLKVAAISPEIIVGDVKANAERIIEGLGRARAAGAEIAVFPELILTSASLGDLYAFRAVTDAALGALGLIAESDVAKGMVAVVGLPLRYGGRVYSAAAVIRNGTVEALIPRKRGGRKRGVAFDFAAGSEIVESCAIPGAGAMFVADYSFMVDGCAVTVAVGDDVSDGAFGDCIVLNPASDIHLPGRGAARAARLLEVSAGGCAVVSAFSPPCESTTDFVHSGHCIAAQNGELLAEAKPLGDRFLVAEIRPEYEKKKIALKKPDDRYCERHPFLAPGGDAGYYEETLDIQAHGLAKRVAHIGAKRVVLGISGGLDSTLALLVAARAMDLMRRPRTDIVAVSMPAFGTTARTKNNAARLSRLLGADFREIDITEAVKLHFRDIGHSGGVADAAFENAQARERTQILMDLANMLGGVQLGTGDLSELALGFATYGGDQLAMYGVNASIPKTLVKALTVYCGDIFGGELKEVLYDIADTPISPELKPVENGAQRQITEEIVGPYELHDFFIYHMFVFGESPREIFAAAKKTFDGDYDGATIKRWMGEYLRRFFSQQFKRSSMCDGPMASPVSFSPRAGLAMPSDMAGGTWLRELEAL